MGRLARFVLSFVVVPALIASSTPAIAHADPNCPDVLVLGTRGSGEAFEGNEGLGPRVVEFWREFRQRVPADVTLGMWANRYPAVAVAGGWDLTTGAGAMIWGRVNVGKYAASTREGRTNLRDEITLRLSCANTRFVLAGYSQGADVTGDVYEQMPPVVASRVIGVALFGDTKFNSVSQSAEGNFEPGRNGLLGKRQEFRVPGQVVSYCHRNDPVCQHAFDFNRNDRPVLSWDLKQHLNYETVGDAPGLPTYPLLAARTMANKIRPAPVSSGPTAVITKVDGAVAGEPFQISGAQSYEAEGRPLRYDWDLDNDGTFELNSPGPIATATYSTAGAKTFGLRVTNDAGQSRSTTSTVPVIAPDAFREPPGKPVSLKATAAPDQKSATLTWAANPQGAPTEGYEVLTSDDALIAAIGQGGAGSLTLPMTDLPLSVQVRAVNRAGVSDPTDPIAVTVSGPGKPAGDLNELWNTYGDQGGHWTGGDRTASVPLPDGRTAWLFSDTFLGTVNPDHSRPQNTPMVHNTLVVQNADGSLGATLQGGTPVAPKSLVETDNPQHLYWVGDGIVEGGALKVLYNRYEITGGGGLDVALRGTALATFSLPSLTLTGVQAMPLGGDVSWGSEILVDGGHTYVYGSAHAGDAPKGLRIARTTSLGGTWEFWNGLDWSATESDAAHVLTGVGTAFSVTKIGADYALVTMDGNTTFSSTVVGYRAAAPTGPFDEPRTLYQAPADGSGRPIIHYDASVHQQYTQGSRIMLSYNVNSLNPADNYADARIYRPRFVSVDWQPQAPPQEDLPPAPQNLTARDNGDGNATLNWDLLLGEGYVFRVYQRNVTLETHFTPISAAYATSTATVGFLRDDNTYEFRVTAEDSTGEGPPSNIATLTIRVGKPEPPTGLTAVADAKGNIRLHWAKSVSQGVVIYRVHRRDTTLEETDFRPVNFPDPGSTSLTDPGLEHQHRYEYRVTAVRSGQESDPTPVVAATANYARPGKPSGLTATARPDGQIDLAWQPPEDGAWYWIYQRDVTEGEQDFTRSAVPITDYTKLPLPVTTCCTFTAGYLRHDHVYEFVVSATNRGGEGEPSDPARATARYPDVEPPSGLTAQAGDGQALLRWNASPTAGVWYWVYQRDVTAGETTPARLPYPLTTCCTFTAGYLANTHVYEFSVSATGPGGESAAAGPVRVTPMPPLPARPEHLTATAQQDGTIKLDWRETTPNTWFNVYQRDVSAGQDFQKLPSPISTCCTFTAGLLTHNHIYEFKVTAINVAGESPPSDIARATAKYALPPAPANLRGRSSGDGAIDLDWDAPAPGLYYWTHWRDATNNEPFQKSVFPTDRTDWRLTSLRHGHVYEFKVTAENQGGEGPASATIQVTSVGGLPAPPSNLTAAAGDGRVTLNWTASGSPNVWYLVWMREAGQSWRQLQFPLTTCCSFTVDGLTNGQAYEFKLAATNASGNSAASNVASARPMPPFPQAPSGLSATAGDGQVSLRWNASSTPNVWYWIEYRSAGGNWTRAQYPVTTCCAFTMSYLVNGATYEFRIRSTNLSGDSAPSNVASARPMPPFPQAPSGLSASAGDGQVLLRWNASSTPNVWYWIEYRPVGGNWTRLRYPITTCCAFTMEYLTNTTTYEFRVLATNLSGDSAPSNVASARPMPPMPQAPPNLWFNPANANNTEGTLSWQPSPTPRVYYHVYFRKGNGTYIRLPYPTSNTSLKMFFEWGRVYEIYVTAINPSGESSGSSHVFVRVGPPDGSWRCATAAGSYRNKLGSVPGAKFPYPSATLCGYRDGSRMNVVMSWNTSNHKVYEADFEYQVWDCDTGALVIRNRTQSFPTGTDRVSWSGSDWGFIDWTRWYKVRVVGGGAVQEEGLRFVKFSSGPSADPRFDSWSGCF